MGVNKAWNIKLRQDQALPPASRLGKVIQHGEKVPKSQLSSRDRSLTNRLSYTTTIHNAEGLGQSRVGSLTVSAETMSSHQLSLWVPH